MKILFQGDSITDAGRDKSNPHHLGDGYPKFVAETLREKYKETDFEFINLGISGNKTADLVGRLEKDFVEIQPDLVSILIGINDVWHYFAGNTPFCSPEAFERNYRTVLTALKERTKAKIIMLEPFLLDAEDKRHFRRDLDDKITIERALSREFADVYIPLDGLFAAASLDFEPMHWSADGVHPNDAGRKFIAEQYVKAFDKIYK